MSSAFTVFRQTIAPFFLLLLCPPTALLFWYINVELGGSFQRAWELFNSHGTLNTIYTIWSPYFFGTAAAWKILAVFSASELLLMRWLPGKAFYGPITPAGNTPVYTANGMAAFLCTLFLFFLAAYPLHLFSPTIIYDNFPGILGALNIFSLLFCLLLLIKGHLAPTSNDCGSSGNPIFDYYWGMELYPRIFGWDVKQFTNCRFGMMGWALIILSFGAKQSELYGLSNSIAISIALQLLYISKFFLWETGYLRSLDIMHDRAGFYICWGCLVWVPAIYTSPTLYLVNHPNHLNALTASVILFVGSAAIMINYFADRQRQVVRATKGACLVWGKKPVVTVAHYTTENGENKENILLISGWWGFSRHFHYIPELLGALCWSLPALFNDFMPYFYVVFLAVLLIDRAFRDDKRCAKKYGEDWGKYCEQVPYKLIPFVL